MGILINPFQSEKTEALKFPRAILLNEWTRGDLNWCPLNHVIIQEPWRREIAQSNCILLRRVE